MGDRGAVLASGAGNDDVIAVVASVTIQQVAKLIGAGRPIDPGALVLGEPTRTAHPLVVENDPRALVGNDAPLTEPDASGALLFIQ